MNGAAGQLATFLVQILRNILAGTQQNPESLKTTWILAEHIVMPAFDYHSTDMANKNDAHRKVVTIYLKKNLSLPEDWIKRESITMKDDNGTSYARLQAQVCIYSNTCIFEELLFL
jgi:hypothetical protein